MRRSFEVDDPASAWQAAAVAFFLSGKMAGNFWQSSHHQQWLLDKQDLVRERQHDLSILTEEEYQKLFIFFSNLIQVLGEQLKLRQQVIATATVYFKRFYARNSLKCIDPLLLAPTSVFLASKVEEFGVISNTRLITTCQTVVKNKFNYAYTQEFPYRTNHILECEFYLLEHLDCCLIVYQPYRPLLTLIQDVGPDDQLLTLAWRIINDSLRTDVCLLYPPYQIAIGCLQIACVILQKDLKSWFAELNADMEKIQEIARYIINLYELWKTYDEKKEIQGLLSKMPKPKAAPQRWHQALTATTGVWDWNWSVIRERWKPGRPAEKDSPSEGRSMGQHVVSIDTCVKTKMHFIILISSHRQLWKINNRGFVNHFLITHVFQTIGNIWSFVHPFASLEKH